MSDKSQLLASLLRELDEEVGTTELTYLNISCLIRATKLLKTDDCDEFYRQFKILAEAAMGIVPRLGAIGFHYEYMLLSMEKYLKCARNSRRLKGWTNLRLKELKRTFLNNRRKVIENALSLDVNNKVILVHSHSHTVHQILEKWKEHGSDFKVIVCEQKQCRTKDNIETLCKLDIPFTVVPAYLLHMLRDEVDMLVFGTQALGNSMRFLMDTGTNEVLSVFQDLNIPSYAFINTGKFCLHRFPDSDEDMLKSVTKHKTRDGCTYEKLYYMYEKVALNRFSAVVTNEGILSAAEIQKLFHEKLADFEELKGCCDGTEDCKCELPLNQGTLSD